MIRVPGAPSRRQRSCVFHVGPRRGNFVDLRRASAAGLAVLSASFAPSPYIGRASGASSPSTLTSVFESWQPPASGNATLLGEANPDTELDVMFGLALRPSPLPELVQSLSTPGTSSYRHYESVAWLARHTGAAASTSTAVLSYLRSHGIVGHLDPTASYVEAAVSVAQATKLFRTNFGRFISNGAVGFDTYTSDVIVAPRSLPELPSALKGRVTLIYGLRAYLTVTAYPNSVLEENPTRSSLLGGPSGGLAPPVAAQLAA